MTTEYNRELAARAKPLLDIGFTVAQAAARMGITKGALSGALRKVRVGRDDYAPRKRNDDNSWDRVLFEPYAERKARKARERCSTHLG